MKHKHLFPVEKMCQIFKISTSSYYYWCNKPISKRKADNLKIVPLIEQIHRRSKNTYGSPRISDELRSQGHIVSKRRVARLMKENNLYVHRKRKFKATTNSKHQYKVAPNLLNQQFSVSRKTQVWVSDITYIKTGKGWIYLTVIIDLFDRKVIGWATSERMNAKYTIIPAWKMAIQNRAIHQPLIFHSDRGIQYACNEFKNMIKHNLLIMQSMSRKGNCWDNAVAESFFKSLKVEAIYPYRFDTKNEAVLAVFEYIETWYNRNRRHSALGGLTINEFEKFNQINLVA